MYSYWLADDVVAYTSALTIVGTVLGAEVIGLLFRQSFLNSVDKISHVEYALDYDLTQMPKVLIWTGLDRLPLSLWFLVACSGFALTGLAINWISAKLNQSYIDIWLSAPLCVIAGFAIVRILTPFISNHLPARIPERGYTGYDYLVGEEVEIYFGTATYKKAAKARILVEKRYGEFIMVKSADPSQEYKKGDRALLFQQSGRYWEVVLPYRPRRM